MEGISNRGNPLLLEQERVLQLVATSCPSRLSEQACPQSVAAFVSSYSLVAQTVKNAPAMWETGVGKIP